MLTRKWTTPHAPFLADGYLTIWWWMRRPSLVVDTVDGPVDSHTQQGSAALGSHHSAAAAGNGSPPQQQHQQQHKRTERNKGLVSARLFGLEVLIFNSVARYEHIRELARKRESCIRWVVWLA